MDESMGDCLSLCICPVIMEDMFRMYPTPAKCQLGAYSPHKQSNYWINGLYVDYISKFSNSSSKKDNEIMSKLAKTCRATSIFLF